MHKRPSYIKDSNDLKTKLLSFPNIIAGVLASFDVESLFTNVPIDGVIDAMKWFIHNNPEYLTECIFSMEELLWLMDFLLRNYYVDFDNRIFIQTNGVSMGSSLRPAAANIFMNFFEFRTFTLAKEIDITCSIPVLWYRYVDDVIACWTCLLYTSPSPRDLSTSRMPSSA